MGRVKGKKNDGMEVNGRGVKRKVRDGYGSSPVMWVMEEEEGEI